MGSDNFKFTQLQVICAMFNSNMIQDGDVFYFSDIWFPGIESIKYMAYFKKINIKMYGILHAGSFTPTDTVNGMKYWARHFECCLINMFDGIFLGSEQPKQDIMNSFVLNYEDLQKFHVTGICYNSLNIEKYETHEKEDIVVFPHRLHPEKQVDLFRKLKKFFHKNVEFIITHEHDYSKDEYYKLLAKSKVLYSASLQENFGFAVLEGCSLGVCPVLPFNNTSYKYMYPVEVLYNTFEQSVSLVKKFLNKQINLVSLPRKYNRSTDEQILIIKNECDEL